MKAVKWTYIKDLVFRFYVSFINMHMNNRYYLIVVNDWFEISDNIILKPYNYDEESGIRFNLKCIQKLTRTFIHICMYILKQTLIELIKY